MPTLETMVAGVYRDLADEAQEVFSTLQIEDFIRGGIVELNRIAPLDQTEIIALSVDDTTGRVIANSYYVNTDLPYFVNQYWFASGWSVPVPEVEPGQTEVTGWVFRRAPGGGGYLTVPRWLTDGMDPTESGLSLAGYYSRPVPYTVEGSPSPETSLAVNEEYLVRSYAKAQGYDLLAHDRSAFAQWQGQTNNTDVSPTQIMQMAGNAAQEWDRQRGLNRVVRKYW